MFCWDEKMTPSPNVHLLGAVQMGLVTVVTAVCQLELETNVFLRFKLCQCVPCYEQQHRAPGQCEATAYVVPVSEQRLECPVLSLVSPRKWCPAVRPAAASPALPSLIQIVIMGSGGHQHQPGPELWPRVPSNPIS